MNSFFGLASGLAVGTSAAGAAWQPYSEEREANEFLPVGVARVDITPREPIRLAGYAGRSGDSEGVAQRLWAKALAIGNDEEHPAVLVTADLLGVPRQARDAVLNRVNRGRRYPIHLIISSTHTHNGPFVRGGQRFWYLPSPVQKRAVDRYTDFLEDELKNVINSALQARRPSTLHWSRGSVDFAANRRVIEEGRWTGFGINPDGPVDQSLPVLSVRSPDGSLRAIYATYACHCTTITESSSDFTKVHGDWAGVAQAVIEERHPGCTVLIGIGCGGDANPVNRGDEGAVTANGMAIADEVDRLLNEPMQRLSSVPTCRSTTVDLPFESVPSVEEWTRLAKDDGFTGYYAQVVLERIKNGVGDSHGNDYADGSVPAALSYPIDVWTFEDDLVMVFLADEVVADYSHFLRSLIDPDRLWITAYANGVRCYIVSKRLLDEGGYEVDSVRYYDLPNRLSPVAEDIIIGNVGEMVPHAFAL